MNGLLQDPDVLRLIFDQCASEATVVKRRLTSHNKPASLFFDQSSLCAWMHLAARIELVCRSWRNNLREPTFWKALVKARWPALAAGRSLLACAGSANISADPRAMYARMCGLRLKTTVHDVSMLLEVHDKDGLVFQQVYALSEARKGESFDGFCSDALTFPAPELDDLRIRGKILAQVYGFALFVKLIRADGKVGHVTDLALGGYSDTDAWAVEEGEGAHSHCHPCCRASQIRVLKREGYNADSVTVA